MTLTVNIVIDLVSAHTTLGNLNGIAPFFRRNDHELNPTNTFGQAHVPGPLGYIWPGSGINVYTGTAGVLPPGYQSPFTDFEGPFQLARNNYSPEGAILTSTADHESIGDLIFAINFSQPQAFVTISNPKPRFNYRTIAIYIPAPVVDKAGFLKQDGFEPAGGINWAGGEATNIVTTLTDNYGSIFVRRADRYDPFGPDWWVVYIISGGNGIEFTPERQWSEWYYVRVNQMKAPRVAGRYFFKIFLDDHYPIRSQTAGFLVNSTMPVENWPVVLVKGEIDPAIIHGTVRYGDVANSTLYGLPMNLPGRLRAVGRALDPYTHVPTNRPVEGRAHFNGSSRGHYELEGLAPGIYDIYASAAGFPEQLVAKDIRLRRGQSFGVDFYVKIGPQIQGEIFAKHLFGAAVWRGEFPISIVLYDSSNYIEENVVSLSPFNLTHSPFSSYVRGNTVFGMISGGLQTPNTAKLVAFPWEGPLSYYSNTANPDAKEPFGLHNGVGPAQTWWVNPIGNINPATQLGSTSTSFRFQFGSKGVYGAPSDFSGMVPQVFATWLSGLKPGRYYIRAHVTGYVQTNPDGSGFVDYSFTIAGFESASDVFVPMDLFASSSIKLEVHFHDLPATIADGRIGGPDPARFLIGEAFDRGGQLVAFNFTRVPAAASSFFIQLMGLGMAGVILAPDPRAGLKYSLQKYRGLRDYGIPAGTYDVRVYIRGYIQASPPATSLADLDQPSSATVTTSTGMSALSLHMFRGAGINATLLSGDWQRPQVLRPWVWNNTSVATLVFDVASRAFVDVIYFWNATGNRWNLPRTLSSRDSLPFSNWKSRFGPGSSFLKTNGSTILDRFGPDLPNPESKFPKQDMASNVFLQNMFRIGFLYSSVLYRSQDFRSRVAIYPGVYAINAWTDGYVQDGVVRLGDFGKSIVTVSMGSQADQSVRLIIGVNFTLRIVFKTQSVFSPAPFNMSMRIRIYDENDQLVAAASTSLDAGTLTPASPNAGFFADNKKILFAGASVPPIPAGTTTVEYRSLAGLFSYTELAAGLGAVQRATLFSADHGVWGRGVLAGSYGGPWTVRIETVNWYLRDRFYPPVRGLLLGESQWLFPYNHLGPYELRTKIRIPNVSLGGEASVFFELDLRGYVQGYVVGINWYDEFRVTSWANIEFRSATASYQTYTWDGWYEAYLNRGEYTVRIMEWTQKNEGHSAQTSRIFVTEGQFVTGLNFYLQTSSIPIPEINGTVIRALLTAIVAVTFLFQMRRRKVRGSAGTLLLS